MGYSDTYRLRAKTFIIIQRKRLNHYLSKTWTKRSYLPITIYLFILSIWGWPCLGRMRGSWSHRKADLIWQKLTNSKAFTIISKTSLKLSFAFKVVYLKYFQLKKEYLKAFNLINFFNIWNLYNSYPVLKPWALYW